MDRDGCPEIRLLATDVDHTITGSDGRIDEFTIEAFALLAERGVPCIITSGRPFPVVRGLAEYLLPPELIAGAIGENGGVLQVMGADPGWPEVAAGRPALLEDNGKLKRFFANFLAECGIARPVPADDNFSRRSDVTVCTHQAGGAPISQQTMETVEKNIGALDSKYRRFLRRSGLKYKGCDAPLDMNYSTVHMHFYHRTDEMNKGDAVLKIIAPLGLRPENVVAVGDSWNDVPMFRRFECRAAPANIRDYTGGFAREIEDLHLYISGKPYSRGFLEIVRFFFPAELERTRV